MLVTQSKSNLFFNLRYLLLKLGYINFVQFNNPCVLSTYKTMDIIQGPFLVLWFVILLRFFLQHSSLLVYVGLRNEFYLFDNG